MTSVSQLARDAQRLVRDHFQKNDYVSLSIKKTTDLHRSINNKVQKSKYIPLPIRRKPNSIYSVALIFFLICGLFTGILHDRPQALSEIEFTTVPLSAVMQQDNEDLGRLEYGNSPISDRIIDYFKGKANKFVNSGFSTVLSDESVHENLKSIDEIGCGMIKRQSLRSNTYQSEILPYEVSEVAAKLLEKNSERGFINRITTWLDHYSINLVVTETFNTKDNKIQLLLEPFNREWDLVTNSDKDDGRFYIEATSYEHGKYGDKYKVSFPRMIELDADTENIKFIKIYNQFGDEEPFLIYEHDNHLHVYNVFNKKTVKLKELFPMFGKWMPLVSEDDTEGVIVQIVTLLEVYRCDVITGECTSAGRPSIAEFDTETKISEYHYGATSLVSLSPLLQNIDGLEDIGISVNTLKNFYVGFITLQQNNESEGGLRIYASHLAVFHKTTYSPLTLSFLSGALHALPHKQISDCDQNSLMVVKGIAAWDVISINKKSKILNDYMVLNTDKGKLYYHGMLNFLSSVGIFDKKYNTEGNERISSSHLMQCVLKDSAKSCKKGSGEIEGEHLDLVETSAEEEST